METGDGSAVADALGYSHTTPYDSEILKNNQGRTENLDGPRPRDSVGVTNFKIWKLEHSPKYTLFDPVRGALWRKYVKPEMTDREIQFLLNAFLKATAIHLEKRVARGDTNESPENIGEINQEFFRLLTEQLRKRPTRKGSDK